MKIEIGESLGCSYLRHVRQCWLVQANWKTSEHWPMREGVDVDEMFDAMRQKFDTGGTVFKKTRDVAQFLKQGEIDVVGLDLDGRLHAMDVAFHEAGLNYGGGADNRVLKKLLRTLMILRVYAPSLAKFTIYFVSPKVNPSVQKALEGIFHALRTEYPEVEWKLLTNRNFLEHMLQPTLEKARSVADTSELFMRSVKLLELAGIRHSEESQQERAPQGAQKTGQKNAHVAVSFGHDDLVQPLVRDLMDTLLIRCPVLIDQNDRRNLMDGEYCKRTVGLRINDFPLLRRVADGREISGHARYWKKRYGEFHVCSQWWKEYHLDNARSFLKFVTELAEMKVERPETSLLEKHRKAFQDYIDRAEGRRSA